MKKMKRVYVCSPLRGDIQGNMKKAASYCRFAVENGVFPIAPHIYCTQFLDDNIPQEREVGLKMGLELLEDCEELWYFGSPSEGMKGEIAKAKSMEIPVIDKTEESNIWVVKDKPNTRIEYLYRDAANYKQPNSIVVRGRFSKEQKRKILDCLISGEYFIPSAVFFPEIRFGEFNEDDVDTFEFQDFVPTDEEPSDDRSPDEIVEAFQEACVDGWL